jgi:hypothetical protein
MADDAPLVSMADTISDTIDIETDAVSDVRGQTFTGRHTWLLRRPPRM